MIPDKNLQLTSSFSCTGGTIDVAFVVPDYINFSVVRDMGEGMQLYFVVTVLETFANSPAEPAAGLDFAITVFNDGGTDTAFFPVGTTIPVAALRAQTNASTKGAQIILPVPPVWGAPSGEPADPAVLRGWKYMGMVVTPRVQVFTAGKIAIDMALGFSDPLKCYRKSYTVI